MSVNALEMCAAYKEKSAARRKDGTYMKILRAAAALLLAAAILTSPVGELVGGENEVIVPAAPTENTETSAEPEEEPIAPAVTEPVKEEPVITEQAEEGPAAAEDTVPEEEEAPEEEMPSEVERLEKISEAAEKEREFLKLHPEIAAMGAEIPEGSDVPVSECDAGFHKYVDMLMNNSSTALSLNSLCVPIFLNSAVYGSGGLIHQDRFAYCPKSFCTDVSYFQGTVNWKKVKAAGIDYCILRAGYRGYGKAGTLVLDAQFLNNLKNAKAAGLKVGAYFFTQAITVAEAKAEADFVYNYIKGWQLDLPVYCDMEEITYDTGRLDSANLTKAQKTAIICAFCDRMKALGYESGVYSNPSWMTYYLDRAALEAKYPIWLANYVKQTKYQYKFNIWQYGVGYIDGISGQTDMDVKYEDPVNIQVPAGFVCSASTTNSLTFKWNATALPVNGYQFAKYNSSTKKYTVLSTQTATSYTLSKLGQADCGLYAVRSYVEFNGKTFYSSYSSPLAGVTKFSAPYDVTLRETDTGFEASWSCNAAVSGYEVFAAKHGEALDKVASVTDKHFEYECGEGFYYITLRPYIKFGGKTFYGSDSAQAMVRVAGVSAYVDSVEKNSVTLCWENSGDAVDVSIYRVDESTGKETLLKTLPAAAETYTLSGLKLAERCIFKLTVKYSCGITDTLPLLNAVTRNGLAGDINSDGFVDMLDMGLLKKYLKGTAEIDLTNADVNCDGKVDADDIRMLMEHMVGSSERMV